GPPPWAFPNPATPPRSSLPPCVRQTPSREKTAPDLSLLRTSSGGTLARFLLLLPRLRRTLPRPQRCRHRQSRAEGFRHHRDPHRDVEDIAPARRGNAGNTRCRSRGGRRRGFLSRRPFRGGGSGGRRRALRRGFFRISRRSGTPPRRR